MIKNKHDDDGGDDCDHVTNQAAIEVIAGGSSSVMLEHLDELIALTIVYEFGKFVFVQTLDDVVSEA